MSIKNYKINLGKFYIGFKWIREGGKSIFLCGYGEGGLRRLEDVGYSVG